MVINITNHETREDYLYPARHYHLHGDAYYCREEG